MYCRLYLKIPPLASAGTEQALSEALQRYPVACVLLSAAGNNKFDLKWASASRRLCHAHDVAFLSETAPECATEIKADGVHIGADAEAYRHARQALGKNAIIGTQCETRHDAMVLAELGTDYVAFVTQMQSMRRPDDSVPDLIEWWSQTFYVPCVAWNVGSAAEAARALESGADFVAVTTNCLTNANGAGTLAEIAAVLENAS